MTDVLAVSFSDPHGNAPAFSRDVPHRELRDNNPPGCGRSGFAYDAGELMTEGALPLGRVIAGVIVGIIAAGVVVFAVEAIGHAGGPADHSFGVAIAAYGLGAGLGTLVVVRIATRRASLAVPVVLLVLAVLNLQSFAHPWWFVPATVIALAAGWFVGARLNGKPLVPAFTREPPQ